MTSIVPLTAAVDRTATEQKSPSNASAIDRPFFLVIDTIFLLAVDRAMVDHQPVSLKLDDVEVTGPLLAARHAVRGFLAGRVPAALKGTKAIASLQLASVGRKEVLRFGDHPLPVQRDKAAIAEILTMMHVEDRCSMIALILRIVSSFRQALDTHLLSLVRTIVQACSAADQVFSYALGPSLRYCRFALRDAVSEPLPCTLSARCFLLTERTLAPVAARKVFTADGRTGHLLIAGLPGSTRGTLIVHIGAALMTIPLEPGVADTKVPAIETIVAANPAHASPIKHFLLSRCAELYQAHKSQDLLDAGNLIWAHTTFSTRAFVRPDMNVGVAIENILPILGKGLLIIGWLWDPDKLLASWVLIDGQGRRTPIDAALHRYDRPDVREVFGGDAADPPGFIAFQSLEAAEDLWPTYQITASLKGGTPIDLGTDLKASRRGFDRPETLLNMLPPGRLEPSLFRDLSPAISQLQARKAAKSGISRVMHYLQAVAEPKTSIVVPIYKRLDHARHQLAHFASDPDFADIELIYVLDAPELAGEFSHLLSAACRLYRRPATLVLMRANRGFAGATNAGASVARGRYLLLLNSDVIPDHPGWCRILEDALDQDPGVGAVGARLIYGDGSIQHAGMDYQRDAAGAWKVVHPGKGLRVSPPSRPVPAVTAACMMLPTDLYRSLGGLSEDYLIGDFEDSDLCMKLHQASKQVWYCADATLYHLERQSMGTDGRYNTSLWLYNQWLHQHRWAATIAEVCIAGTRQPNPAPRDRTILGVGAPAKTVQKDGNPS